MERAHSTCDSCKRYITSSEYHLDITQVWRATNDPMSSYSQAPYRRRTLCKVCVTYVERVIELPVYREPQDCIGENV